MNYHRLLAFSLALLLGAVSLWAQSAYTNYIEQYKSLAIDQMQRHRIPASITLAQGLLESAAGQSRLARLANNHFGIKASGDWTGPVVLSDDDSRNEQFRKYKNVSESYEDHSLFLQKPRYAALFNLKITDYKGWASTLRACGYATNPRYADNLVSIIERYSLHQYDTQASVGYYGAADTQKAKTPRKRKRIKLDQPKADERALQISEDYLFSHRLGVTNNAYHIVVLQGDNLKSIAKATGKDVRKLRRYNNIPRGCDVYPGQIIYLTKKGSRNPLMSGRSHVVEPGESLLDIAQRYGVTLKSLYKMNNLDKHYSPQVGDRLVLWK